MKISFLRRIVESTYLPGDSDDDKLNKSSLALLSLPFALAGLAWGTFYFHYGFLYSGLIPFCYGIISVISFFYFIYSKNFKIFRNSQLIFILVLPFMLQISLGGFVASSAVIIWSFIGPMGALMFLKEKIALRWFIGFLLALLVSYLADDYAAAHFDRGIDMKLVNTLFLMNIATVSSLIYVMLNYYVRNQADLKQKIFEEKSRSESLLLNILPSEIAEELKEKGEATPREFDKVSVLFTDFKQFTQLSEHLSASHLVGEINTCFKAFDEICEKYRVEKIKTIGDAYMAVGGLPVQYDNSVRNTVLAGIEMVDFMVRRKSKIETYGKIGFEMRVGIHTGPIVAGIVGVKKFQYDIWGDTVNTANRLESSGQVGKVNISESTYQQIKDDPSFVFEFRGKLPAKGKGEIEMYFVRLKNNVT